MNEQIKKAFATTLVHLILAGRREIEDVPVGLRDLVKADLGINEPSQAAPAAPTTLAAEQTTEQEE
ncbi:CD1375 family protein [Paenibacillus polymyxa]|uniref:CD1375 family protein n=1 Tax=Paenibacillus TaxID=44249 RepID=UPI000737D42D|nr:CD1375 family protein [Paenibacillus polymyxa]